MKRLNLGLVILVLALWAGAASGQNLRTAHYAGKIGGKTELGITAKLSGGRIAKITDFSWGTLTCGEGRFEGGASKTITVKKDAFKSTQRVWVMGVALHLTVQGTFKADETKASGWLKITGGCTTGKKLWRAKAV